MNLKKWLKKTGTKQEDIAEAIGKSQSYIAKVSANGTASLDVALAIHDFTNGEVDMRDLAKTEQA